MTTIVEHAARDLFDAEGRQTRSIRFYFQGEQRSAERLSDYRARAIAQIDSGASPENLTLDRELLD